MDVFIAKANIAHYRKLLKSDGLSPEQRPVVEKLLKREQTILTELRHEPRPARQAGQEE